MILGIRRRGDVCNGISELSTKNGRSNENNFVVFTKKQIELVDSDHQRIFFSSEY